MKLGNPIEIIDELISEEAKQMFELDDILNEISMKIIKYRIGKKMTQKEFAEKLSISQVMVSKLESGNYNPTIELLWKLSKNLNWNFKITLEENIEDNMLSEIEVWSDSKEGTIEGNTQN